MNMAASGLAPDAPVCAHAGAAAPQACEEAYGGGLAYAREQRWEEAAQAYETAIAHAPLDAVLWLNLAHARLKLGELERGALAASRAVALQPGSALALTIAARCLQGAGREHELVALFRSVDLNAINDANLYLQLGQALYRLGRFTEAIRAFFDVLRCDPRCAEAFAQLGNVFQLLKLPEQARESFRNALALGRTPVAMISAIVFTSLEACSWETIDQDLAELDAQVRNGAGQPVPFYSLAFGWSQRQQLGAARWHARRALPAAAPLVSRIARNTANPIRLGYVSSDFQEHATAYLIAELLELHDRRRFSVHAYSYGDDDRSPMRRRIEQAIGENFVDARQMPTPALAARIRADAIDVLVDLKGYTLYARNDVFAYRAAPIQVNFLGFPGSLGSEHYDYIIGDPIVTPLEHADGFTEKIAQLPNCYQPNDRRRPAGAPGPRAHWQLPEDAFVFCCLNANYKITAQVFDRWCALLRQIDDAVLWLFQSNPQARQNLALQACRRGIEPQRLLWAPESSLGEHLARMRAADLFLDTSPVNAHTTASEALWVGLPLLTVLGESFAARVAASLLGAAGLPELIATDLDDYERIALDLAHDRAKLRELRERLAKNRDSGTLFDTARYARDFEALIGRMVERLDRGLAPEHLPAVRAPTCACPQELQTRN